MKKQVIISQIKELHRRKENLLIGKSKIDKEKEGYDKALKSIEKDLKALYEDLLK